MKNDPAVFALTALHAELGGKIKDNERDAQRLRADMVHVEAVLKILRPELDTRRIAVKRRYNPNPLFKRGHVFRGVLDLLRKAEAPMTVDEIVVALFRSKGVEEPTRDQRRHLYGAVNSSLRGNEGKSVAALEGRPRKWALAVR